MTVAVSLAHTTKMMQEKNDILVRNLKAPELMAQVNELCCGLTGSLTTGEMKVELIYAQNITIKNERDDTLYNCALSKNTTDLIEDAVLYCNECHIEISPMAEYVPKGNDTEVSLLNWLKSADVNLHERMLQR
jgi:magnesium-transporting ATPase (P-type)